jgi:hypothetical protein
VAGGWTYTRCGLREGDVVARLHRGPLCSQGGLDLGRLRDTPGAEQPFRETGILLIQLPQIGDARLLELDVQHATALPRVGGDEIDADEGLDNFERTTEKIVILQVDAQCSMRAGLVLICSDSHPEIADGVLRAPRSRLAQVDESRHNTAVNSFLKITIAVKSLRPGGFQPRNRQTTAEASSLAMTSFLAKNM